MSLMLSIKTTKLNTLNPNLYGALVRLVEAKIIKGKEVKVKNAGCGLTGAYTIDPITRKKKLQTNQSGETYWVCCPKCGDSRYRLCINHKWNSWDATTQSKNLHLIHCFNEECQSNVPGFVEDIQNLVSRYTPKNKYNLPPKVVKEEVQEIAPINLPGMCVNIKDLLPTHPAARFLLNRGYDLKLLGNNFGVSFCYTSNYPFAQNRIIFPVYMDHKLVGWQARYVDSSGGGNVDKLYYCYNCKYQLRYLNKPQVCEKCNSDNLSPVPKYWTCPGFKKSQSLMNYDNAVEWMTPSPFVIIVEGPMDAIQIGSPEGPCRPGPAVALYGHTLSPQQKILIWKHWKNKIIVIMLDADVYKEAQNLCSELKSSGAFKAVLPILLPDNRDPADCDHKFIWKLLHEQTSSINLNLFD